MDETANGEKRCTTFDFSSTTETFANGSYGQPEDDGRDNNAYERNSSYVNGLNGCTGIQDGHIVSKEREYYKLLAKGERK